jgi:5-methylcytosine-specific restriction endonuclease McrA
MAWIEVHQALRDHRKVLALAELLNMPEPHVVGHLIFLWQWTLENAPTGSLAGVDVATIADAMDWRGSPGEIVKALLECGLLDSINGVLSIHDWWDYVHLIDRVERHPMRIEWERMTRRIRPIILERDNYTCQNCGATDPPLEIDHIVAIARGGTNDLSNLRTLCRSCNRQKGPN